MDVRTLQDNHDLFKENEVRERDIMDDVEETRLAQLKKTKNAPSVKREEHNIGQIEIPADNPSPKKKQKTTSFEEDEYDYEDEEGEIEGDVEEKVIGEIEVEV